MTKGLCILGSTGSVGRNCLRVIESLPGRFQVIALSAGRNLELLAQQILCFRPRAAVVSSSDCIEPLRQRLQGLGYSQPLQVIPGVTAD